MAIVRTRIVVEADGHVSLAEPLPAGEYLADIRPASPTEEAAIDWSTFPFLPGGSWPENDRFDRGDIYGEDRS